MFISPTLQSVLRMVFDHEGAITQNPWIMNLVRTSDKMQTPLQRFVSSTVNLEVQFSPIVDFCLFRPRKVYCNAKISIFLTFVLLIKILVLNTEHNG